MQTTSGHAGRVSPGAPGRYGYADPREAVEAVALRVVSVGSERRPLPAAEMPSAPGKQIGRTRLYGASDWQEAPLWQRETLAAGQSIFGPAIVLQPDATTFVAAGWKGTVDVQANLALTIEGA